MKASRYNWIVDHDGEYVAYNGLTGAMAILEEKNRQQIEDIMMSNQNVDKAIDIIDKDIKESLIHGGYIIDDAADERKLLQVLYNKKIYQNTGKHNGFTLVMTRKCNFKCVYCYEHKTTDRDDSISEDVLSKIVEVAGVFSGNVFSLGLYGGEPLLEYEKCIDVCSRCKEVVESRDKHFTASIVTNGYLLTLAKAKSLRKCGVKGIQITVDGSKETHNKNRPLIDGTGTYDRIMRNIKECAGIIPISIRMNTMDPNQEEIKKLKNTISNYNSVSMYVAPVDLSCRGNFKEYTKNRKRIAASLPKEDIVLNTVFARTGGCAANGLLPAVVLPDGGLVRCWEHMDESESSCNLLEPDKHENLNDMARWVSWNPYIPGTKCYECRYLPNCGGGCPRETVDFGKYKCLYVSDDHYIQSIRGSIANIVNNNVDSIDATD